MGERRIPLDRIQPFAGVEDFRQHLSVWLGEDAADIERAYGVHDLGEQPRPMRCIFGQKEE